MPKSTRKTGHKGSLMQALEKSSKDQKSGKGMAPPYPRKGATKSC